MAIIEDLEEEGVRKMELQPGTLALLGFIAKAGVRRALMTRNSSQATEVGGGVWLVLGGYGVGAWHCCGGVALLWGRGTAVRHGM